jgi:hypothetical protein
MFSPIAPRTQLRNFTDGRCLGLAVAEPEPGQAADENFLQAALTLTGILYGFMGSSMGARNSDGTGHHESTARRCPIVRERNAAVLERQRIQEERNTFIGNRVIPLPPFPCPFPIVEWASTGEQDSDALSTLPRGWQGNGGKGMIRSRDRRSAFHRQGSVPHIDICLILTSRKAVAANPCSILSV